MPTRRPTVRVRGGNSGGGGGGGMAGGGGMGGGGTIGRGGTGATVKRSKTLTRPERHVAPEPLINPAGQDDAAAHASGSKLDWWTITSWIVTFWAPSPLLAMAGIKEANSRQAWREKITLCFIAIIMGGIVGFATMGLQSALCPGGSNGAGYQLLGSHDCECPTSKQLQCAGRRCTALRNVGVRLVGCQQYPLAWPCLFILALGAAF